MEPEKIVSKNYNIILFHMLFMMGYPLSLYHRNGYIDTRKALLANVLIGISMITLYFASKKFKIIDKDLINTMVFTLIGIGISFLIFGYPVAWIIKQL